MLLGTSVLTSLSLVNSLVALAECLGGVFVRLASIKRRMPVNLCTTPFMVFVPIVRAAICLSDCFCHHSELLTQSNSSFHTGMFVHIQHAGFLRSFELSIKFQVGLRPRRRICVIFGPVNGFYLTVMDPFSMVSRDLEYLLVCLLSHHRPNWNLGLDWAWH